MATLGFKAKEQNLHDDLDEFDFNSFDFDVAEPPDDRHPIMKTLSPVGAGMKDYVTNSSNIERFVKAAMPSGYGQAYDLASEAGGELKQLYNGVQNELRPVKESSKRLLRKVLPTLDGKIPKKLKQKLEEMSAEDNQFQGRQADPREEQLAALMTTIFEQKEEDKLQSRNDVNERDKIRQGFEQIRHRDEMGQLDAIRTAVESQAQYQNKITYNVQKKQLELGYRQFWALAELNKEQKRSNAELLTELKATRMNTALPDFVKQTMHERFKELVRNKFLENAREGMFGGAKDYMRKFTRNLGDQALGRVKDYSASLRGATDGAETMADMAGGMGDMPGFNARDEMIRMLTQLPMDYLAEKGSKKANSILGKNAKLRRGGAKASHFVNTVGDRMHERLTAPEHSWGRFEALREMLAGAAPTNTPESRMEVDTLNRAHEPKPFNRSNSKSLDEVIPGLLARIHREIRILRTGDEKTELISYDFAKNKFSTEKKIGTDLRQRIAGANTDRANKYANQIITRVNRGKTLTPEQIELTRKKLIEKSVMGESIDSTKIHTKDQWGGGEDGQAIADAFSKYLKSKDGKLPENAKSYDRQLNLLRDHRSIVSGIGDPRVLLQQMVNSGQLESLKSTGILDENNNLDRKVFAEWLMNAQANTAEGGPVPAPDIGPIPPIPSTNGTKGKKNKVVNPQLPTIHLPGPTPTLEATPIPQTQPQQKKMNLHQFLPQQQGPLINNERVDEILKELRLISEKMPKPVATPQVTPQNAPTVETNVQTITDLLQSLDKKYTDASANNAEVLANMLAQLEAIAQGSGGGGQGGNSGNGPGRNFFENMRRPGGYTSLFEHLKDAGLDSLGKAKEFAGTAGKKASELWDKYLPQAKQFGKNAKDYAGARITDLKGKLANVYGDVIVLGEKIPRLRIHLLKAGQYRDKLTGRVITSLEEITGDVIDSAGNIVITLDEFYNSYITGSVNKKVREVFTTLKNKVEEYGAGLKKFIPAQIQQLKAFAQTAFKKLKDLLPPYDVYVKTDLSKPLLYANAMRYEQYVSKKTGKPIKHPREIDGVIMDSKGNIVVTEEHLKEGLVDISGVAVGSGLGRIVAKAAQFAGVGFNALRLAGQGVKAAFGKGLGGVKDYFKDFTVPFSEIIVNSKQTVNWLQKIHEMLDARLPNKGKKVRGDLTKDGIRDGSIEDIRLKREEASKKKSEAEATKAANGSASSGGMLGKLFAGLTGMFGKKKKEDEEEPAEEEESMLDQAKSLYETFAGDKDDEDKPEDNSPEGKKKKRREEAKKRLKRMQDAARARTRAAAGPRRGILGRMGRAGSSVANSRLGRGLGRAGGGLARMGGGLAAKMGGAGGVLKALGSAVPMLGSAATAIGGSSLGGIGTALMSGGGTLGNIARAGLFAPGLVTGAASMAGSALGGLGSVAGGALGAARVAAPWLLRGLGFALSAPVSIALTAGYLGYKAYQYGKKTKMTNLSKLRLAQYGVSHEDDESMEKIFTLESMLEKHATMKDGNVYLDEKKLDLKEIAELFGVTEKSDLQLFNQWYKRRFIPVYRKWLGEVRKVKPDGELGNIETIIDPKNKLKVAEEAVNTLEDVYSNMVGWNREHLKLTMDSAGVHQVLENIRIELAKEVEAAGGEKAKSVAQSGAVSSTKDANALAQKALTDKASYVTKDKEGKIIDAASMDVATLTEKIKKGDVTVSVAIALPKNLLHTDAAQLDALTSIRFKAYGLTVMTADKARMLGALEMYMADNVATDTAEPKLTISSDQVLKAAGEVFGVPNGNGEHAQRWRAWFNGRFLPVFLLWIGTLRKKTGKTKLADATLAFPMIDQGSLARAIIGTQGVNTMGGRVSIWDITSNPWSEPYELNTNADSTAGNLEAIRLVSDKVRLGEVTAKNGKVQETGKANQEKGFWAATKRTVGNWFGVDTAPKGEGVRATGDTMAPKDSKPLSGMGDTINFSGNGGGNYLDLPKPSGDGWAANRDMIIKAAAMSGVDAKALITTIAVESSFNPNAAPKNPNSPSTAKGLGQHLDSSWQEDLQRDGKKFGIPNGTTQFDARASALMTASRLKFNGQQLAKNLGRAVTVTDLYLAHLMGLGGATKFLKSPEGAIGAEQAPTAATQHPEYFYKGGKALTVKEVYAGFTQKLSKRPTEFGVTDADMKSAGSTAIAITSTSSVSTSSAAQVTAAAPGVNIPMKGAAPVAQASAPTITPPTAQKASFATTPSAGTPLLNGPVSMDKGKSAVMGKGVPMVNGNGAVYELILQREDSEEDGMYGTLRFPDGTVLNSLELPWRDNAARISSIPPGTYPCKIRTSASLGEVYEVQKVPGRTAILIHAGNSAGSSDKGMKADSQGCILLGMDRGRKGAQKIITASKPAMKLFHEKMGNQPFTLTVRAGKNNPAMEAVKPAVNFDPVRAPAVATAETSSKVPAMPAVNFKPTAGVATTLSPEAPVAAPIMPRLNPTVTSFSLGSPSKAEMQNRDQAISAVIAPKLDTIATTLDKSLKAHESGVDLLKKILEEMKTGKKVEAATESSDRPSPGLKIKPVTNTTVPVPQRRNY